MLTLFQKVLYSEQDYNLHFYLDLEIKNLKLLFWLVLNLDIAILSQTIPIYWSQKQNS